MENFEELNRRISIELMYRKRNYLNENCLLTTLKNISSIYLSIYDAILVVHPENYFIDHQK